jgi:hypothetical protein
MGTLKTFRTNSQSVKILAYLQEGNFITVEIARCLGFGANCRSRISDIENAGYKIKHENIRYMGGYVAKYSLEV